MSVLSPPAKRSFTLIELLVVVAIISILASMLLPVIGKAQAKAKESASNNNMKQMLAGMVMYADDYDDQLYENVAQRPFPVQATPNMWKRNPNFADIAREYAFVHATGHDVVGAMPWSHSGNTSDQCWSPWYYYPGFRKQYASYYEGPYSTKPRYQSPIGPSRYSRARPMQAMWSEMAEMIYGYALPGDVWRGVNVNNAKSGGPDPLVKSKPIYNPSFRYKKSDADAPIRGSYAGYYDGHIAWVPFARMLRFGHIYLHYRHMYRYFWYIRAPYAVPSYYYP